MSNYIYYSLILKENSDVELLACIDMDTIDDDEPTVEYLQNNGTFNTHTPDYWKVDGVDLSFEMDKLKEIESYEWDWISQALVEWEDSTNGVFIREFKDATLYISYDEGFSLETAETYPAGAIVKNDYPHKE